MFDDRRDDVFIKKRLGAGVFFVVVSALGVDVGRDFGLEVKAAVKVDAIVGVADLELGVKISGEGGDVLIADADEELVGLVRGDVASETDVQGVAHFNFEVKIECPAEAIVYGVGDNFLDAIVGKEFEVGEFKVRHCEGAVDVAVELRFDIGFLRFGYASDINVLKKQGREAFLIGFAAGIEGGGSNMPAHLAFDGIEDDNCLAVACFH